MRVQFPGSTISQIKRLSNPIIRLLTEKQNNWEEPIESRGVHLFIKDQPIVVGAHLFRASVQLI